IEENLVFDQYVPTDGTVHLFANGDSEECIQTMLGQSLRADLAQFGLDKGQSCLLTTARDPGTLDVSYAGPDFGAGSGAMEYETPSSGGLGGHCSVTTTMLCVIDSDCPPGESCATVGGAFTLRYRIERL